MEMNDSRMKVCSGCTKKKLTLQRGLLCSLTDEKPTFEGECENYDEAPVPEVPQEEDATFGETTQDMVPEIGGWLSLFLWLGLGGGVITSFFYVLPELPILSPLFKVLIVLIAATAAVVAIATIYAFIKRKPNAVSLARTYIVMVAIDSVVSLYAGYIMDDPESYAACLRSVIWVSIWFAYFMRSKRVAALIPHETRVWKPFEKAMLAAFVGLNLIFVGSVTGSINGVLPADFVYSNDGIVESTVTQLQAECPMDMGDNMYLDSSELDGKNVIWTYRMSEVLKSEMTSYELYLYSYDFDEIMLNEFADWESDMFLRAVFNGGYTLTIRYTDALGELLCESTLSKEDLEAYKNE